MTLQAGSDAVSAGEADPHAFLTARAGKIFRRCRLARVDMDPAITELVIDIDGQVPRYAHGPTAPESDVAGTAQRPRCRRKSPPARVFAVTPLTLPTGAGRQFHFR